MSKNYKVKKAIEIEAPASICYDILCDIKSYSSWFKHIKQIIIKEELENGRVAKAFYIFDIAVKKNLKILWEYEYQDDKYKLICNSIGGDFSNTKAVYEFRQLSSGKTLFNFAVEIDFGVNLPAKIINFIINFVLKDFFKMIKNECERRAKITMM